MWLYLIHSNLDPSNPRSHYRSALISFCRWSCPVAITLLRLPLPAFFPEQFLFISCHGCFSEPFPLNLCVVLYASLLLRPSISGLLSLTLCPHISFWLELLIRHSISHVHSSLSLLLHLHFPLFSHPPPILTAALFIFFFPTVPFSF